MTDSDMLAHKTTVLLLVVEENICTEGFQEHTLVHPAQEQCLVDTDVPGAQGAICT